VSIGLPAYLAPQAIWRSLVTAQHTVAFTLLSIAILATLVFQGARPGDNVWPAALALLPSMGLLLLRESMRPVVWCIAYLLVSGIAIHLHALILLSQPMAILEGDGFSFLAAKVSIIMVGGSVLGVAAGVGWAVAGYVVAQLAVGLAQIEAGQPMLFDLPTLLVLLGTVIVIPLIAFNTRRQLRAQPRLHQAAADEQAAELRYRIEVKAAALMHDTVLNHLAAIAEAPEDTLHPDLREQVQRDVYSLASEEWLAEAPEAADSKVRVSWQHSGLFSAIQESRLLGLDVDTTGDLAAVARLKHDASIALGLAVKQCLVNVLKHSGTRHAEVAVYGTENSVSVMVVDTGVGFNEDATGRDRLGLRSSVRKRMELVGGQVTVWSTPGRGTSVMIKVPADLPASAGQVGAS
jgi:signal transduction histidine kinase